MNGIGEVIRQEAGDSVEKARVKVSTRMTESARNYPIAICKVYFEIKRNMQNIATTVVGKVAHEVIFNLSKE